MSCSLENNSSPCQNKRAYKLCTPFFMFFTFDIMQMSIFSVCVHLILFLKALYTCASRVYKILYFNLSGISVYSYKKKYSGALNAKKKMYKKTVLYFLMINLMGLLCKALPWYYRFG